MKSSGIGGQAVMEGVMMKNKQKYAVSVRVPSGEIVTDVQNFVSITEKHKWLDVPIIRGVVNFVESMYIGVKTLTFSADFFDEEETAKDGKAASKKQKDKEKTPAEKRKDALVMGGTVAFSILLSVVIFMMIPYFVSSLITKAVDSPVALALIEGVFRLALFIGYVAAISLMKDIKRVFMYHGAEHKSINCIESGLPLTVENVRGASRQHKRCGTSFMLIVMVISIFFFCLIRVESAWLRLVVRLLLIPVIAGVSYEFIKLAGRSESKLVNILSKPGLWLQGLTTREPDDEMIEVAIASVEAVFDWKAFLENPENQGTPCCAEAASEPENKEQKAETAKKTETSKKAETAEKPEMTEKKTETDIGDKLDVVLKRPVKESTVEEGIPKDPHLTHNEVIEERRSVSNWPGAPTPDSEEEDEVLKALDKYFTRK